MSTLDAPHTPTFPPLMYGEAAADPVTHAQMRAIQGCDAGLVAYDLGQSTLQVAIVFAPDVTLAKAAVMLPLCAVGFQNALGALGPPETAVQLEWDGGIRLNAARCGRFGIHASTDNPAEVPDWMVIDLTLPLWPLSDAPGEHPEDTALYAEGCTDVQAPQLLESWSRHTLTWVRSWEDDGIKPLHEAWRGLAWQIGEDVTVLGTTGTFLGVDENFGLLLRDADGATQLIPLTRLLETTP